MQRSALRTAVVAGVAALSSVAVWSAPAQGAAGREMSLTFESGSMRTNAGNTALTVKQLSRNGGTVTTGAGVNGTGGGIRFPAYGAGFAALTVTASGGGDVLSPGNAAFTIGADFTLNAKSEGGSADNGNNLLQRGLFSAPMQYKLDVDGRKPGCRVKGSQGAVLVRSSRTVAADTWFRVTCARQGSKVTLTVTRVSDKQTWTYSRSGSIGTLKAPKASLPLSIGAKVNGGITASSDQFNGRVDNAFYNVS